MRRIVSFGLLALLICVALFIWLKPDAETVVKSNAEIKTETVLMTDRGAAEALTDEEPITSSSVQKPKPVQRAWVIKNGRLVSGDSLIRVSVGTSLVITIQSDKTDELHLHGYDIEVPISSDNVSKLTFIANETGYFEVELHHRHQSIAAIEVIR